MTLLKDVPPWAWVVLTAVLGVGALAYHKYAQDDTDTDWTQARDSQPPMRAPYPNSPGTESPGRPMGVSAAFRSRAYPDSLASADFSIIGEF